VPEPVAKYLYYGGLFAFSGAITNKLAIYMIFNRVPMLYGSGVIELNFERFKSSIKDMIMEQFFTKDRVESILKSEIDKINLSKVIDKLDYSAIFDSFKEAIMESKFAPFINMVGGESAIEQLRGEFNSKIKVSLSKLVSSKRFNDEFKRELLSSDIENSIIERVEVIIDSRLKELTPKMVKELVERLIKDHLEWLVVWGGSLELL